MMKIQIKENELKKYIELINRLKNIREQAENDRVNRNWGTYDLLIDEYNNIKIELELFQEELLWVKDIPLIQTVPLEDKGSNVPGGTIITGMGTNPEKNKYSEIISRTDNIIFNLTQIEGIRSANNKNKIVRYIKITGLLLFFFIIISVHYQIIINYISVHYPNIINYISPEIATYLKNSFNVIINITIAGLVVQIFFYYIKDFLPNKK